MSKIRLFIAAPIPEEIRRRLAEVEKDLMATGAGVKWVPERNFHITLKFLGYVEPERLDSIARAVESAVAGVSPFEVGMSGVGAFPKPARPSVVWVGISKGGEELKALAERIETAMERLGFERESREFSPHITLGRVKSPRNLDALREAIERAADREVGSYQADCVKIMQSDLRPTGPIYTPLREFGLATSDE